MEKRADDISHTLLGLFLVLSLLTLPFIANKPFYSKGEPREALVAVGMIEQGNWILPTRYGDEIATKPPMVHWLMSVASLASGSVTEFTARLPSAVSSILICLLLFSFLTRYTTKDHAILSVVVLFGSIEWYRASLTARVDMTLSAFLVAALILFFEWLNSRKSKLLYSISMLLAAATLTKGPVALILPGGIFTLALLNQGINLKESTIVLLKVFLPAVVLASIWYILAYNKGGQAFLDVVINENFSRFNSTMEDDNPHTHPAMYLYATVLLGLLPWTLFLLPIGFLKLNDLRKIKSFNLVRNWFSNLSHLNQYSLIVVASFLIFYSIPSSKRSVYLLPIYPFLAIWVAALLQKAVIASKGSIKFFNSAVVSIVLVANVLLILISSRLLDLGQFVSREKDRVEILHYQTVLSAIYSDLSIFGKVLLVLPLIFVALFMLKNFFNKSELKIQTLQSVFLYFTQFTVLNALVLPAICDSLSAKSFSQEIVKIAGSSALYTASTDAKSYGLNFYLKNRLEFYTDDLNDAYVVVRSDQYQQFVESLSPGKNSRIVYKSKNPIERPKYHLLLARVG